MTSDTRSDQLLRFARGRGIFTARDVMGTGIHTQTLSRLVHAGALERVARGRYRLSEAPVTEHHGFAIVAAAVPNGVVCLLSALSFHKIGTQLPHEVWIAIDRRARRPALRYPRLRVFRFGGNALTEGIEIHRIEGVDVRVYSPAKTIADCFKYRNKCGIDVAMEAVREAWHERRFTMDAMSRFARICRVDRVMRPYLELLVA